MQELTSRTEASDLGPAWTPGCGLSVRSLKERLSMTFTANGYLTLPLCRSPSSLLALKFRVHTEKSGNESTMNGKPSAAKRNLFPRVSLLQRQRRHRRETLGTRFGETAITVSRNAFN